MIGRDEFRMLTRHEQDVAKALRREMPRLGLDLV
jgi:hypothetical protein